MDAKKKILQVAEADGKRENIVENIGWEVQGK